jgi:hypothetical protein
MDPVNRRNALAAGAALVLTSCVGPGGEAIPAVGDDTATIAAWIEQHQESLPTEYDEIALLPFPYRLEIASRLSPEQKSALIQEHLRRAIEARPGMTEEQRAVIDLAREAMTPAWYAATPDERQVWGDKWGHRIGTAFEPGEYVRIFGSIGPEDDAIRQMITEASVPSSSAHAITYDDVAHLSRKDQYAVFVASSPDEQAAIYAGHLAHYAELPGLTAGQRAAVERAATLVSSEWYALTPDAPGWRERVEAPREEMERLLRGAFGEQASRVMMTIGPE